ncbi:ribonuclease D [Vibrio nigripulchritudo]|uniref:ribonuclease D n=1 Tax=Vibrio nigripulchritudo TaxID=28173 RepID=UPI00190B84A3|nr:ribonuclease D [Vibrio nigripulchritudo]BCL68951.1 ribonuclease D [Vibrio nigripulchritudo]BDU30282.1 ribonuclease D [Vibrio nigripulchritudo]
MNYQIVDTKEALEAVCLAARDADTVMLDTEFVRTRTFYPQLGLIQLFDGNVLSLIDPTVISDMTSFVGLLKDTSVLKVLHACGEDLEVFAHVFGTIPVPMMDTQIMAAFLGHGLSTGFAALVKEYLGVELDKSEARTDWLARPLTNKQLEYAAADVHYLLPMYEKLEAAVKDAGWWEAAQQESDLIASKRVVTHNPEKAYLDIKGAWQLRPNQLAILKILAQWRLEEALKRDLALNFVFREQNLWACARFGIKGLKQMEQQGFDHREIRRHGNAVISMVKKGEQVPQDEHPDVIERLMDKPGYKQLFKQLKDEVKKASQKSGLATEFLASKKQINQLISWVWKKDRNPASVPDVMQGWRKELFGARLDKLV